MLKPFITASVMMFSALALHAEQSLPVPEPIQTQESPVQSLREEPDLPTVMIVRKVAAPDIENAPNHDDLIRSEKASYEALTVKKKLRISTPAVLAEIQPKQAQNVFLWFFAAGVALIGLTMMLVVRSFNIQHANRKKRLDEAEISEQKIVLGDLIRVLNNIEIVTRLENMDTLHEDSYALLEKAKKLMDALKQGTLQDIPTIESYIRTTHLYRDQCSNR